MKKITSIGLLLLSAAPAIAAAQATGNLSGIQNLVIAVGTITKLLIPILVAIAIVVFFWGLIQYIRQSGKGHDQGRNTMIAGLVSLFVMVCLWGIIGFAASSLGVDQNKVGVTIPAPSVSY